MTLSEHAHTHTAQDDAETIAIFRKFRDDGDIIALFPGLNHETDACRWGHVMSYQHIGQHSEADYQHVIAVTNQATEEDYQDLAEELESIGYRLRILKRKPINL